MAKIRDKSPLFGTIVDCISVWKGVGGQSEACGILKIQHPPQGALSHPPAFLNLDPSQRGGSRQ